MGAGASSSAKRKQSVATKASAVAAFSQRGTTSPTTPRTDLAAPETSTPRAAPTPRRVSVVHPPEHPSHLMAACRKSPDAIIELLDGPIGKRHVNYQSPHDGSTPLQALCWHHDRPDVIRALLARGADPGLRNKYGATALMNAANQAHEQSVDVLLEAGVDRIHAASRARAMGHDELAKRIDVATLATTAAAVQDAVRNFSEK